ncbi:unnamed protein product [Withania somnifera]
MNRWVGSVFLCFISTLLLINCSVVAEWETCSGIVPMQNRYYKISILDFGGVGDGRTLNTKAFKEAIFRIQHLKRRAGTLLYIPAGVYLTGPFNLTSRMTLYLARDAVIKATQSMAIGRTSYGRGRERPGGRYMSLLHGHGLHDVIITGENGTIDGQGDVWWNMWRQRTLRYTRPHLIELMNSGGIIISKDSSSNVCIEDSYISVGDDLVAVKSGWDQYGIAYGRSSHGITIQRITGSSPFAGIAVGSETSGGVVDVLAEHINLFNMGVGIHIKTNIGRGGMIRNITVSNVYMENTRTAIKIAGVVGDHLDEKFNPNALPIVKGIKIKDVWGEKVLQTGLIHGLKNSPFSGICLSNINLHGNPGQRNLPWKCSDVRGAAIQVSPWPCTELISSQQTGACSTYF